MQPPYPINKCADCGKQTGGTNAKYCWTCARKHGNNAAMSPEDRNKFPLCGAKKRMDGTKCRAWAGMGTDHPGIGRCKHHGGGLPNHRKHAVTIEATKRMITLGVPMADIEPHRALAGLLRATAGHVAWLHSEMAELDDLSTFEAKVIREMYDSERDRLTRISSACIAGGVAERSVRIAERQQEALSTALINAAKTAGLDDRQRRALGAALREELTRSAASHDEIDDDDPLWATPTWDAEANGKPA